MSHRGKELVKKGRRIREEHLKLLRQAKVEWVPVAACPESVTFAVFHESLSMGEATMLWESASRSYFRGSITIR